MRFTIRGTYFLTGTETSVTWEDGVFSGDLAVVAHARGVARAKARRREFVGPEGSGRTLAYLRHADSAAALLADLFRNPVIESDSLIERLDDDVTPPTGIN